MLEDAVHLLLQSGKAFKAAEEYVQINNRLTAEKDMKTLINQFQRKLLQTLKTKKQMIRKLQKIKWKLKRVNK